MSNALPAPRLVERPLPVAWDDVPVTWTDEAIAAGSVFVCRRGRRPVPVVVCSACGSLGERGRDGYLGRVPDDEPGSSALRPRLLLTRCLACGHDVVVDLDAGEVWDLDESDYGPAGSVHPDQVQGQLW
jgi:hypothetical protein